MGMTLPKLHHHWVTKAPVVRCKKPTAFAWDTERRCLVYAKNGRPVGPTTLRQAEKRARRVNP